MCYTNCKIAGINRGSLFSGCINCCDLVSVIMTSTTTCPRLQLGLVHLQESITSESTDLIGKHAGLGSVLPPWIFQEVTSTTVWMLRFLTLASSRFAAYSWFFFSFSCEIKRSESLQSNSWKSLHLELHLIFILIDPNLKYFQHKIYSSFM